YAVATRRLLFSGSIDALLAGPEVPRTLNRLVVAEHLVHRWVDSNETYYAAVRRVPPGHVFVVENGRQTVSRYWDPSATVQGWREDELEQFGPIFERAVARAVARGRAAIFLSGGFDSVSIAAMAASIASRRGERLPHALSLAFPDPECSEDLVQRS